MANKLFANVNFNLEGDGVSTQTTISLQDLKDFNTAVTQFPQSVSHVEIGPGGIQGPTTVTVTASVVSGGRRINFTFSQPLQSGGQYQINVILLLEE